MFDPKGLKSAAEYVAASFQEQHMYVDNQRILTGLAPSQTTVFVGGTQTKNVRRQSGFLQRF